MKPTALVCRQQCCSAACPRFLALTVLISFGISAVYAQNEPVLVPDAVDYQKLLPILPDAPQGWTADKPEGSTRTSADSDSQTCIVVTRKAKVTMVLPGRSTYPIHFPNR